MQKKEQDKNLAAAKRAEEDSRKLEEAKRLHQEQQAEQERQQREQDLQRQARESRRRQIRERLDALPEEHLRKVESLEKSIAVFRRHILDLEQYLAQLQSRITELSADIFLGRAFGGGGGGGPNSRESVLNQVRQQYREYSVELSRTQDASRNAADQIRMLNITYEQERNRLLAELNE